mmetsp:Transcript_4312/g.9674  ORF Transcript_4312/g.9674 Transcript_4312/m.9674 type:complete len:396 (-) Transcript_4312:49-1236(-)
MAMRTYQFAIASAAFSRPLSRNVSPLSLSWNPSFFSDDPSSRRRLHRPSSPLRHRNRDRDTIAPFCGWRKNKRHTFIGSQLHSSSSASNCSPALSNHERRCPRKHHHSISGFRRTGPHYTRSPTASQKNIIRPQPKHSQSPTRLFGSKPNSPNAKLGYIHLDDDRDDPSSIPINLSALQRTIETTRDIIGYPTYDVSCTLVDDDYMEEINGATRGVGKPTDVLSFCFQDKFIEAGVLGEVEFDNDDYYNLGDMLVDVDYVKRRCEEDKELHEKEGKSKNDGVGNNNEMVEGEVISEQVDPDEEEDDEYEYEYVEVEVDEYDDRGVAPAMQYEYDPEIRIHMLIVHGMLHLVGYDHIEDDDYELMVVREDEVLAELRKRLGDDFGVAIRLPAGEAE